MTTHHFSARDFSRKTRNALTKKGLTIVSSTWIPAAGGDFANGETAYLISDGRLHRGLEVNALVA